MAGTDKPKNRDAQATRGRILAAAKREFAESGLGGLQRVGLDERDLADIVGEPVEHLTGEAELLADLADQRGECIHSACSHYQKCFIERSIKV